MALDFIILNKYKNQIDEKKDRSAKKYTNKMIEQGWQLQVDIPATSPSSSHELHERCGSDVSKGSTKLNNRHVRL